MVHPTRKQSSPRTLEKLLGVYMFTEMHRRNAVISRKRHALQFHPHKPLSSKEYHKREVMLNSLIMFKQVRL